MATALIATKDAAAMAESYRRAIDVREAELLRVEDVLRGPRESIKKHLGLS